LRPEIDTVPLLSLELAAVLISKIEARKEQRFKDPFIYNPN